MNWDEIMETAQGHRYRPRDEGTGNREQGTGIAEGYDAEGMRAHTAVTGQ